MITVEDALDRILNPIQALPTESIPVTDCLGRVSGKSIEALLDLPGFDNSAMDGFALRADDLTMASSDNPCSLKCVDTAQAGCLSQRTLRSGECMRIFTGAALPAGADAVVMQEDVEFEEGVPQALFTEPIKPWENIRFKGEDIRSGTPIVSAGQQIGIGLRAVLYGAGIAELEVFRKPRVGLLATGDELREPGIQPIAPGQIYETNRSTLEALVQKTGCSPVVYPLVPDSLEETGNALKRAFEECDAVITSGGVSVGQMDFVKQAFEDMGGQRSFWRIAMRPGKPFVFGTFESKYFFGLPGNPVSTIVTFLLLVRPALHRMGGNAKDGLEKRNARLTEDIVNKGDRTHFVRVVYDPESDSVYSAGSQGSHRLLSLARSNALLKVPPDTVYTRGTEYEVLLWD